MKFEDILEIEPYSLKKEEKRRLLTERAFDLTEKHRESCKKYADILKGLSFDISKADSYENLPFLPVRLFKELDLKSVSDNEIVKTLTSSGTTGQRVSKIYLDRTTSSNQQKAMVKIVSHFTGSARMPMIIIDSPSVLKDRNKFSARGAGILGFSIFGSKKIYALDDDMKLDIDGVKAFLEQYRGQKIFLFGFTFMVWQHFYKELERLKQEGITFDLSQGIMIHGGGWKKLQSEAVSPQEFHDRLKAVCGIDSVHDYYGMVEQTGCIYMQCECGHLHTSIFSDVITRRPKDFSVCDYGETGIIQVVSTIPESYPGHSLLTEDEGVILGEDDCPCGRKGKYFRINGRIAKAEIRGCSDTYAADRSRNTQVSDSDADDALKKVNFLVGKASDIKSISALPVMKPFDGKIISFLSALSKELMTGRKARLFPDVVTLGFWLRKASLESMKERFIKDGRKVGRGVAFHIAPSNVPVNYAYSLFSGLLCGNANIVRVPSKDFLQIDIINSAIKNVLMQAEFSSLAPYINLVRYERSREINDYFSGICDARIIWGGDSTVEELRKSPVSPRAVEVTFADRYSLAVIDSDKYTAEGNKKKIASDFYNDTYLSDQNACTSPRAVVWLGKSVKQAREIFWKELADFADEKYMFQTIQGVDKLSQLCLAAAANIGGIEIENASSNLLYRVNVKELTPDLMNYRGNSGFFYEYECSDIMEIRDFCGNTHCQTIGAFCAREAVEPLLSSGIKGVDRVVSIGHTMDFDLEWDGYNLVEQLTRTVAYK